MSGLAITALTLSQFRSHRAGRVVFDGAPAELSDSVVQNLYGLEAAQVMHMPAHSEPHSATVLPFVRAAQTA